MRINALIAAALLVSFLAPGPVNEKVSRVAVALGENAGKVGLVIGFAGVIGEAMMAAMELTKEKLGFNPVYLATAIGSGSLIGSWMNDSGFWIFSRMSGLTEAEALKTWTPLLLVLGSVSHIMTFLLSMVLPRI